jgi:hypothetical protein
MNLKPSRAANLAIWRVLLLLIKPMKACLVTLSLASDGIVTLTRLVLDRDPEVTSADAQSFLQAPPFST